MNKRNPPLGEERLDLQVGQALVQVAHGRGVARNADLRLLVAQALGSKAFPHPACRIPVADHRRDVVGPTVDSDFSHHGFEVRAIAPSATPPTHHVLHDTSLAALAFGMDDRESESICPTPRGIDGSEVTNPCSWRKFPTASHNGFVNPCGREECSDIVGKLSLVLARVPRGVQTALALKTASPKARVHQEGRGAPHQEVGIILTKPRVKFS